MQHSDTSTHSNTSTMTRHDVGEDSEELADALFAAAEPAKAPSEGAARQNSGVG